MSKRILNEETMSTNSLEDDLISLSSHPDAQVQLVARRPQKPCILLHVNLRNKHILSQSAEILFYFICIDQNEYSKQENFSNAARRETFGK